MRAIQQELGEGEAFTQDVLTIREQLAKADFPDYVRERAEAELNRLSMMPAMAPEVGIIHTITTRSVARYLGPPRFQDEHLETHHTVDVAMGLA